MSLLNILQLIAAFNFLFIGCIIFLSRKKVSYGVSLLGVFLIAKGITLFTNLTYFMDWSINSDLVIVLSSALFLYAPFLYFFARFLVNRSKVILQTDYYHFIPFVVYLLFNSVQIITPIETILISNIITVAYYIQTIGYTLVSFRLIHAKGDRSNNQNWFKYLLLSFLIVWAMMLSQIICIGLELYSAAELFKTLGILFLLILANITVVMAIYSPEFFFKGLRIIKSSNSENKLITEDNFKHLLTVMSEKGLYTNPNLKVSDLSYELGMSERNTSLLIKSYHGGNFIDFLNTSRIEEAKRLFIEEQDTMTISEVLYAVGFNSKSVFNTVFKKKVGMTPSQFKKHNSDLSSAI